jgi:3-deoxy-7-phosphoheptulonate synthase
MAYRQSAATLNLLRAFAMGGYANLENVHQWMLGFVKDSPQGERYRKLADRISETMDFMKAIGITSENQPACARPISSPATKRCCLATRGADPRRFDLRRLVRHVWPHDLDRRPYASARPCACRILPRHQEPDRPEVRPDAAGGRSAELIDVLNPANEAGRLTLICRFGHDKVAEHLPRLIRAVEKEGRKVVWSCDPMHGNTITLNHYKTRPFERILSEVESFFQIHRAEGTHPGGIHIEMTGKDVTECTGGARAVTAEDLHDRYHTHCDPRLNADQALELAFLLAERMKGGRDEKRMAVNG